MKLGALQASAPLAFTALLAMSPLLALCLGVTAHASQEPPSPSDPLGCGAGSPKYKITIHKDRAAAVPSGGKAVLYAFWRGNRGAFAIMMPGAIQTQRFLIGINGRWVGAVELGTYGLFELEQGLAKLCFKMSGRDAASLYLTVEAGKTYYVALRGGAVRPVGREQGDKEMRQCKYAVWQPEP